MSKRGPYRRHTTAFKLQVCSDIRSGTMTRSEARRQHTLSSNLVQLWLTLYDRGELHDEDGAAETLLQYEVKIAALERKVGQLTMELDLLKKTPRLKVVSSNEPSSIVSGPKPAAPSVGAVK